MMVAPLLRRMYECGFGEAIHKALSLAPGGTRNVELDRGSLADWEDVKKSANDFVANILDHAVISFTRDYSNAPDLNELDHKSVGIRDLTHTDDDDVSHSFIALFQDKDTPPP